MQEKRFLKALIFLLALSFIIFSLTIAFGSKIFPNSGLPTWDDIFEAVGFREKGDETEFPLSVHFIDVGQGDAIFVKSDFGNFLVDSGEYGNAEKVLSHIKSYGVNNLDYIFATHYHTDHIGSMSDIIDNIGVKKFIVPDIPVEKLPTTKSFEHMLRSIERKNIQTVIAIPGDRFDLGELIIEVLGPISRNSGMNDLSLVLKITYGEISFLFSGDAESKAEVELVESGANLKANVLKAPHHGSKTSSTARFMNSVKPDMVVISCGRDNSYGHPHKNVLQRYDRIGAKVLRTDYYGNIIVYTDGKKIDYVLEKVRKNAEADG